MTMHCHNYAAWCLVEGPAVDGHSSKSNVFQLPCPAIEDRRRGPGENEAKDGFELGRRKQDRKMVPIKRNETSPQLASSPTERKLPAAGGVIAPRIDQDPDVERV